jgi:predicted transposase YdaD
MISVSKFFKEEEDMFYIKGKVRGKVEGIVEGKAEGIVEGIAIGAEKSQKQFATKLKERGYGTADIAELISMPVEEIERI